LAPGGVGVSESSNLRAALVVSALLGLFGLVAIASVAEKSNTFDEIAHITAGYSYWHYGDYRLHPENGILPQRWEALPLLAQQLKFPATDSPDWQESNVWEVGKAFFFHFDNNLDRMLLASRAMIVLAAMALCGVVFYWSQRLFGTAGGFVSLLLCIFCPTILAHGRLATSDMVVTLWFVASLGAYWIVLHRVTPWTVLASALAMALLFVSKFSAAIMLPVSAVLLAIRLGAGRPLVVQLFGRRHLLPGRGKQLGVLAAAAAAHVVIVVAVIWAMYGFRYATFREAVAGRDHMFGLESVESLSPPGAIGKAIDFANRHHLLPESYLHGFAYTLVFSEKRNAFLDGEYSQRGWRSFFVRSFFYKTPMPTLAVLLMAAIAVPVARRRENGLDARRLQREVYRALPLWVYLIVYWVIAILSNLNIGHRHILPTYPMMFILAGAAGYWFRSGPWGMKWLVSVAIVALAVESLAAFPNYLAYFNGLAGGPRQGYRHLVDSSLDWGQDLPGLKRWLDEEQTAEFSNKPVYLSYFGTGDPEYCGIDVQRLEGYFDRREGQQMPLEPGTYCISATMLQGVYSRLFGPWTEAYEKYYQQVTAEINRLAEEMKNDPALAEQIKHDPNATEERRRVFDTITAYNHARAARLFAFLRLREPDDFVGYSILVYRLDERDLEAAQFKSPAAWEEYFRDKSR
jgi:4-amino-4-deoxy-L-arabinose transferase-like glycosyltransferase